MHEAQRPVLIYDRIAANKRRTFVLLLGFFLVVSGLCLAVAFLIGLPVGATPFIMALVLVFAAFAYFGGGSVALAASGARQVNEADEPALYRTVENLCIGAGLPMPKVYMIEDGAMNAFATGRDPEHASVAVTRGLFEKLDKLELEGVIGHELSHISNRDTLVMTTVVVLVGVIALIADLALRLTRFGAGARRSYKGKGGGGAEVIMLVAAIIGIILAPIAARLIASAVSRQREYLADASGALLTRYPEGLARALEKIRGDTDPLNTATKATEHLFFVNPLTDHASMLNNLFSTHPPIEDRIRLLRSM